MTDFRKYGSPFDPKFKGSDKSKRTATTAAVETDNARNASMDLRRANFSMIEQAILRELAGTENSGGYRLYDGSTTAARGNEPSGEYRAARNAVSQWIVPAPEQSFDDIVGNENALAMLKDAIRGPVDHKDIYAAYDLKSPKGALLYGPPGCGKTMFARAAVAEMKRLYGKSTEFISISGTEIQSPYVGVTESYIKAVFTFARLYKAHHGHPLLVFIDEAEVLLPDRNGRGRPVQRWEESNVATFLAEMDGMQESGAFVMLATNRPENIDQAVLRDGRCDFKIAIKRPTVEAIEAILRKHFKIAPRLADSVDDLVFAAVESFLDPSKVIHEAHMIQVRNGSFADLGGKNFTLEHIVSGAMATSVVTRASRLAFQRDKATGKVSGISVSDVIAAVNAIFEENRGIDHSFALREFMAEYEAELRSLKKII